MDINLTLIGQSIAMIIFVWFCMKFIWPPLVGAIEDRRKSIADGIAAGEKGQRDLEQAAERSAEIIREAREKAAKIADEAKARYNEILGEAKTDAQKERERQLASARAEIEQERNRARDDLRGQVSAIAVASAERILKREIDERAHRDLIADLVSQI